MITPTVLAIRLATLRDPGRSFMAIIPGLVTRGGRMQMQIFVVAQ